MHKPWQPSQLVASKSDQTASFAYQHIGYGLSLSAVGCLSAHGKLPAPLLGAGAAAAPAYAADTAAGRRVWRLLMPQGGPPAACPPGTGEGEFQPLGKPCTVVGALHSVCVTRALADSSMLHSRVS